MVEPLVFMTFFRAAQWELPVPTSSQLCSSTRGMRTLVVDFDLARLSLPLSLKYVESRCQEWLATSETY